VRIPVIAAEEYLMARTCQGYALGASGVQMATRFVVRTNAMYLAI